MQTKSSRLIYSVIALLTLILTTGICSADDVNVELVSHFGGVVSDVAVAGNYAYIGQGQDLVVIDITNISNPSEVGRVTTPSMVKGIALAGNYAYIASEYYGLVIVDISDTSEPTIVGTCYKEGEASGIAVSGNYAYTTDRNNGLMIFDVTDPSAPLLSGSYYAYFAQDVDVVGNYAYVASGSGLEIVNISAPSAPKLVSSYDTSSFVYAVVVEGYYAYLAEDGSGLLILDVSNPAAPTLIGSCPLSAAWDVFVVGNYAYVASAGIGFEIIDISDPSIPTLVGVSDNVNFAYGIAISGDYAYVSDYWNGLVIIDVNNPSSPTLTGSYDTTGYANDVSVSGNCAYIVSSSSIRWYNGQLQVVDISNPKLPTLVGTYDTQYENEAFCVDVVGNYAYVISGIYLTDDYYDELDIVDISNPSSPILVGSYSIVGWVYNIVISGNYAYIANDNSGLEIVDISNPSSPILVGSYDVGGNIDISGNYAYVANGDNGLVILDVSDPSSPELAGTYDDSSASDVVIYDDYAYVTSDIGMVILDITNPSAPTLAGNYAIDNVEDVAISSNYAYIADSRNGLVIVDIGDPLAPKLAGGYDTGDFARRVVVADSYIYLADDDNGLVILRVDSAPTSTVSYAPVYDNRLRASSPNTVLSTSTYIDVGKSTSSSRDLLLFDLSAYKPTDIISKATLSLYWYYPAGATRTSDTVVEVYRPAEWDTKYVTWNTRMSGVPWTIAGGNWYDKNSVAQGTTPYASTTFKASTVPDNKYYEFDVTHLVQEYVDETYENTGFFLKAKTESGNYIAFYSSDWSNDAQKPKLTVSTASVDNPPVAEAGPDQVATTGSVVTFDGSNSTDDKGIVSYSWDFDDGTQYEAATAIATHTYAAAGTYNVMLTVTDTVGQTNSDTLQVIVSSPTTTVTYTPDYDNRLRASSPNTVLSTTTYIDIGKSTSSSRDVLLFDLSAYKPTDIISKATLSLYWYYPPSTTRTSDTVVEVYRPVEWDPKYVTWNTRMSGVPWTIAGGNWYDKNGVAQGTTPYASVTFKASTVPDNKYYEFDVTQLVQEYVSGKYKNTGFFLKAKTESGNYIAFYSSDWSDAAQKPKLTVSTASVDNSPVAEAGPDQVATTGSVVTFDGSNSTDDKGIVSYSWDFDASNGITTEATGVTATKTYATAGNYTVTLTVTDTIGQKSSDTLKVVVTSPTSIYAPVYDNRLRASSPNTVLSTTTYIDVGKSTSSSRDVLFFDLSAYKPTDIISKATLSLYWYYPPSATRTSDTVVEVYRPVEWDPNYVTWNSRMSGVPWTTAGGNWYDKNGIAQGTTPYASATFRASTVPDNKYYEFDVTQLVQEYVNETYANTGFFLKAKTESGNYIAFYSSEWTNAAEKPKLTITR